MPEDDLRSTIDSAISAAETGSTSSTDAIATPATPVGTPTDAPASPGTSGAATTPAGPTATPVGSIPPVEGQTPGTPKAESAPADTSGTSAPKAPGQWTPQARERWAEVHPDVQQEIIKRERETSRAMTQSADARKFHREFRDAIRPFEGFIAAEKSDPIKATVNMMQTAALLRTGTPTQKANLVSQVIQQYGIDLQMLDGILAGQQPQNRSAEDIIAAEVERRTKPLLDRFTQRDEQIAAELSQEVDDDLAAFAKSHEFYHDLKDTMADLMETNHRRGGNMDLTAAYEAATLLSEPVRRTLEGRKTGQSAQRSHQVAQQARSGAISVKPSDEAGVTSQGVPGDSIRDALNYAFAKTSGR